MESDPFRTQRDVGPSVVTELSAAGFSYAEEVGRGGYGIVYKCTQTALDRLVAVKVLNAELDEENRERFLREQRAMGRLTGHPNIVGVLQVGETESGFPYLVMQYHRQGSLDDADPPARSPSTGRGRATRGEDGRRARDRASLGILHRDVKPANILLTDYGEPALGDFGIAHIDRRIRDCHRHRSPVRRRSPPPKSSRVIRPSRSSDVYGLGATLFAALTGHAAFERRSGEQLVAQFLRIASESAPDLRESGIPDDISAAVERAMARDAAGSTNRRGLG